jgi:hypothetical protein
MLLRGKEDLTIRALTKCVQETVVLLDVVLDNVGPQSLEPEMELLFLLHLKCIFSVELAEGEVELWERRH